MPTVLEATAASWGDSVVPGQGPASVIWLWFCEVPPDNSDTVHGKRGFSKAKSSNDKICDLVPNWCVTSGESPPPPFLGASVLISVPRTVLTVSSLKGKLHSGSLVLEAAGVCAGGAGGGGDKGRKAWSCLWALPAASPGAGEILRCFKARRRSKQMPVLRTVRAVEGRAGNGGRGAGIARNSSQTGLDFGDGRTWVSGAKGSESQAGG